MYDNFVTVQKYCMIISSLYNTSTVWYDHFVIVQVLYDHVVTVQVLMIMSGNVMSMVCGSCPTTTTCSVIFSYTVCCTTSPTDCTFKLDLLILIVFRHCLSCQISPMPANKIYHHFTVLMIMVPKFLSV